MIYEVVAANSIGELVAQVNTKLTEGWQLQGGVSVSSYYASWQNERKGYQESEEVNLYAQAMVNPKDSKV